MHFFTFILALLCSISASGQDWKVLTQKTIGLEYKIPSNWYVGGIIKEKDNKNIVGTMNIATDYAVSMYILSSPKDKQEVLEQVKIGGYTFKKSEFESIESSLIRTTYFEYEMVVSIWEEDEKQIVLQFNTTGENGLNYIVYFWGEADSLEKNEELIQTILNSIKSVEVTE